MGSIALMLEPVASTLEVLLRRGRPDAGVVSLDPNVRPGLISDRVAYVDRFEGWIRLVDILEGERGGTLAWLYPRAILRMTSSRSGTRRGVLTRLRDTRRARGRGQYAVWIDDRRGAAGHGR